jgi:hypothetical protein
MGSNLLLDQLLEIERSIGVASNAALRKKVQDAEDSVLQMRKQNAEDLLRQSSETEPKRSEFAK